MQPKQRILEATSTLFHKQGYHSTGINQIIEESKVAKASFYQHFKSKEDLCVAFLERRHEYWFEQLQLFTSKSRTPKTKILSAFDFLIFMNEKENFRGCSFLNILSEISSDNIKVLAVIQSHKQDLRQHFKTLIEGDQIADHIYLLFESALIESQLFKDNWPIKQAIKITNNLIA